MKKIVVTLCLFLMVLHINYGQEEKFDIDHIVEIEEPEIMTVPFAVIEKAPRFPGCTESSNNAIKRCTSDSIKQFIEDNQQYPEKAKQHGKENSLERVYAQFIIDQHGKAINIQARSKNPALEEEAKRILKLLPTMIPGEQRGNPVWVSYYIPIIFSTQ